MEWLTFIAGEKELGMEAGHVYRVVDDARITPVPGTPACHMGLIYHRGELFDVVHLGTLLSGAATSAARPLNAYRWIILLKWAGKKLALVPDRIVGLLWLDDTQEGCRAVTRENRTVMRITPGEIWKKLMELPYGFK